MLRYHFWHRMLNTVYSAEWWIGRSVTSIEAKFFKAQIDYHAKYDDWNNVLEYLEDSIEEDDEDFEDDDE